MDPSHLTSSHSHGHDKPNSSDLMGSAKLLAEAAQSTFNHESDKIDRARVASAAADILDAASHYGKLEEKSFGKYVEKAEDYLHKYGSSHSSAGGHHAPHAEAPASAAPHHSSASHHSSAHSGSGEEHSESGGGSGDYLKMAQGFLHSSGGQEHSGSGGGSGDYLKMAQGFLHSGGGEEHSGSGGGYGDYMKMAQGFLKK